MFNLPLDLFTFYTEQQLKCLEGGPIRGKIYPIVIHENGFVLSAYRSKLRNNLSSQNQLRRYPSGYLPFVVKDEEWNFDLTTLSFEVRRLKNAPAGAYRSVLRKQAAVLKSPPSLSEVSLLLDAAVRRTSLEERLRRRCDRDRVAVEVAAYCLQDAVLKQRPARFGPATGNDAERLEFYVTRVEEQALVNLLDLLIPTRPTYKVAAA